MVPRVNAVVRPSRDALVLRLFLAGHSYREIGSHPQVNLSAKGVGNVIHQQLAQASPRYNPVAQQAASIYIERLETMLRVTWPQALTGNLKAVMVCLRVLRQELQFYGLDEGVADDDLLAAAGLDPDALETFRQRRPL